MARQKLYQIIDIRAGMIGGPIMPMRNPGPATREFYSLLANKETQPGRYPADFNLLYLGEQDDETGQIFGEKPEIIATGSAWAATQSNGTGDPDSQQAARPLAGDISRAMEQLRHSQDIDGQVARAHLERMTGGQR